MSRKNKLASNLYLSPLPWHAALLRSHAASLRGVTRYISMSTVSDAADRDNNGA